MYDYKNARECGIDEPMFSKPELAQSAQEDRLSNCPNGCKYYVVPETDIVVLAHNPNYGCRITADDVNN